MHRINLTIIIACFIFCSAVSGQEVKQEVLAIADSIASFDKISLDALNPDGSVNKQYDYFTKLVGNSKPEELIILLNEHESAIIKCYSFWGLAKKQYTNLFDILNDNLLDERSVNVVHGGFAESLMVSDFLINIMTSGRVDTEAKKMSQAERKTLDSTLIFSDNIRLNAKVEILRDYQPSDNQYYKIKELANSGYSPFAYVALAKFKNEQDLEYINNLLSNAENEYYALLAIRAFPHETFYNKLLEIHNAMLKAKKINYSNLRALYQALVQYPTEQTVEQFEKALKKTKGFTKKTHTQYLWLAIDKYPNSIFNAIKPKLKLSEFEKENLNEEREY